ncbi:MAG: SET domain-containing protein-lysine N-methyltransferase [Ferruginibacter sp.]|jgi:SET domain-containing protein|nr:SET domain-containing protein-lysine N-methyltransferase [Chitinophagaceae bacterium]MBP6286995.1 SET domain-containing protein-lysine N-methyltransferase [Ferruginibacter sp.]MBU9936273.1 SET domain-containing protein-lysine N-methyltransferase [Ferruginibacter sp.]
MLKPYLFVDSTNEKGRGVFTRERIPANTVIEISPVIAMEKADREYLDKTLLHDYIFEWGKQKDLPAGQAGRCCMALGLIPIYNHSYKSNCEYFMDFEDENMMIKTVRVIEKGEELTINYNGDWNDANKVWFDVK